MPFPRALFFGAALTYVLVPGHPLGVFAGIPLTIASVALALALAVWAIGVPGSPPRVRAAVLGIAALAAARLAVAMMAPAYGLVAEYRAGGAEAPVERSTEWLSGPGTRVDQALLFRGAEFPVHFFNDVGRFNYYTANEPKRDLLPFTARWTGLFSVLDPGRYRLVLEANGAATISMPGLVASSESLLSIDSGQRVREASIEADLSAGLHPLAVTYTRPSETMPWLVVSAGPAGGRVRPLGAPDLAREGTTVDRLRWDAVLRPLALGLDVGYLALLALIALTHLSRWLGRAPEARARVGVTDAGPRVARWERPLLGLFAGLSFGSALAAHHYLFGQAVILSGGNDWLAYAGFARDVLLDGPLLSGDRPLGQGQPYYYQPLYAYWLAGVQLLLGEGLWGALLANALLGAAANLLVYCLARELFGRLTALIALVLFGVYLPAVFAPTTGLLLSENLLVPLVPLLLLLLARAALGGRWATLAAAGLVLGLAGLTRSTPLAVLPPAILILLFAWRRLGLDWRGALPRAGLLIAVCVLTVGAATTRNLIVSGRPVPITSSAGANLWEAHRPSPQVDLSRIDRNPFYERLSLDRQTREVVEFIRQDPIGYAQTLVPMALYAMGVVGAPSGTSNLNPWLVSMWIFYAISVVASPAARSAPTWFVHAFVLTHLAQVSVFFSHQYGLRLILPMYVALAPIAAHGIAVACLVMARRARLGRVRNRIPGPAPARSWRGLTPLLLVLGCGGLAASAPSGQLVREAFYGLRGDAALAARQALRPELMRLADAVYFAGDDSRSEEVAYLRGLAYPDTRWFDGAHGLVFPPSGELAAYVLPERAAADFARGCLGDGAQVGREQDPLTGAWIDLALASLGDGPCRTPQQALDATFDGVGRILGVDAPRTLQPGQPLDALLRWEALGRPRNRARPFVRLIDGRGRQWGQTEAQVYPSSSWRRGEVAFGRGHLEIDPTLPPGDYHLEVGFTLGAGFARRTEQNAATAGQFEASAGRLALVSRSVPLASDDLPITIERTASFGDVRLLGANLNREVARPGDRLRLSLFWRNSGARLPDSQVRVVLRQRSAGIVREWRGVPVDGTYPTTSWKPGEVVRDTWDLVLPQLQSAEAVELAVALEPTGVAERDLVPLTELVVEAVTPLMVEPAVRVRQDARVGDLARLIGFDIRDRRLKPGETLDLRVVWQALASTDEAHVVSVGLVGVDDRLVVRQDSEPAGGRRPTTGWVVGEYVEDQHRLRLPRETPRGRYQIVVSVSRLDDKQPAQDDAGNTRIALAAEVVVE